MISSYNEAWAIDLYMRHILMKTYPIGREEYFRTLLMCIDMSSQYN